MADDTKSAAASAPKASQAQTMTDDKATREARKVAAKGGQVILDPESDASFGARGGLEGDIAGNTRARDEHLVSHGLNPRDPDPVDLPANTVPASAGSAKPDTK